MKQNKRKHLILIVILLSIAFVSILYVRDRDYAQKNKRYLCKLEKRYKTVDRI